MMAGKGSYCKYSQVALSATYGCQQCCLYHLASAVGEWTCALCAVSASFGVGRWHPQ
jgi:hypothetical protein